MVEKRFHYCSLPGLDQFYLLLKWNYQVNSAGISNGTFSNLKYNDIVLNLRYILQVMAPDKNEPIYYLPVLTIMMACHPSARG